MAVNTKTVGTVGRDYSTLALWHADLDDGTNAANNNTAYGAGDDAVAELYNDSVFTDSLAITNGGTIGLASITMTVPASDRHDGTAGTGARIAPTTSSLTAIIEHNTEGGFTFEWLDVDGSAGTGPGWGVYLSSQSVSVDRIIRNNLVHDITRTINGNQVVGIFIGSGLDRAVNNFVYAVQQNGSNDCYGIDQQFGNFTRYSYNNTVSGITALNGSSAALRTANTTGIMRNNLAGNTSATVTATDILLGGGTGDHDYNATTDGTGGGGNSITVVFANEVVNDTPGSEDLHLASAAVDCVGAGEALGTVYGAHIDIDGEDRIAGGNIWDIGADQAGGAPPAGSGAPAYTIGSQGDVL